MRATITLKTVLAYSVCMFLIIGAYAQPTPPAGKYWEVVPKLTDEFDSWDGTKWTHELWDYGNTPVHMLKSNANVSDGKLWIKATPYSHSNAPELWMASSRVASKAIIAKYPMYMECKMRANSISSYNTFWLNNGDANNRDEVDMCESNANPSWSGQEKMAYTLHSQYFIVKNSVTERNNGNWDNHGLSVDNPLRGVHWDQAYHTIGVWLIDARNIQFYLNGEKAGKVTSQQDFTLDMKVIWDVWTQNTSWVGGLPEPHQLEDEAINTMYVDWIHTWTLVDEVTPTAISLDSNPSEIRAGASLQMEAGMTPENGSSDITWSTNDAGIIDVDASTGEITAKGTVGQSATITATSNVDGSISGSKTITIVTFQDIFISSINVSHDGLTLNTDSKLFFTASVLPENSDNDSVTWSVNNSNASITETGILTALKTGTVTITATAKDNGKVTGSATITIKEPTPAPPPSSVNNSVAKDAGIYPNPATDILNIDLDNINSDATLNIYNKVGQLVLSQKLNEANNQISISGLHSDIYVVQVLNGNNITTQKIVVE